MTYRAGIVGCGRIAGLTDLDPKRTGINTHAKAYACHPKTTLVAVADPDTSNRDRFSAAWPDARPYEAATAMLEAEQLDILSIASPPDTHLPMLSMAAEAGVKLVFCEKPVADNAESAEAMSAITRKHGLSVIVNYFRRYDTFHRNIHQFIRRGGIGPLQTVRGLYSKGIANNGSHLIDLMRWYVGDVSRAWANRESSDDLADPTFDCHLVFESGVTGGLQGCDDRPFRVFELDMIGESGRLRLDSGYTAELFRPATSDRSSALKELQPVTHDFGTGREGYFTKAIDNLIAAAETGSPLDCCLETAIGTYRVVDALKRSLEAGDTEVVHQP